MNGIGQYTMNFTVASGLAATTGTITLTLPLGTVIPNSIATSSITVAVNGGAANNAHALSLNLLNITVQITTPTTVNATNTVEVVVWASSGISNPKELGMYKWNVKTSTQQINASTSDVEILASTITSISGVIVEVSP